MRILIDPGSHHLLNVGDVAMLQSCVERLSGAWPDAHIDVLTAAPDLLARHCPATRPLAAQGRYEWVGHQPLQPSRPRLRGQLAVRASWVARRWRRQATAPEEADFLEALLRADLLLFSGRGGLTDAFADESLAVLLELDAAARIGLPTAMLGQGMGPLTVHDLLVRTRAVLPHVRLFGVREPHAAPALLAAAGVSPDRVLVTGDDAIDIALRGAPDSLGTELGLGLRVADYSGVGIEQAAALGARLRALADSRGVRLLPVPISCHPIEDDSAALARAAVTDPGADGQLSVRAAVEQAGRCRVVVAGSYHAAVFALAQGVPAVCVAASPYYVDKFVGLATQFGRWCRVVRLDGELGLEAVDAAVAELWESAPAARTQLLKAARRQSLQGERAYARLFALAGGPVGAAPA